MITEFFTLRLISTNVENAQKSENLIFIQSENPKNVKNHWGTAMVPSSRRLKTKKAKSVRFKALAAPGCLDGTIVLLGRSGFGEEISDSKANSRTVH